MRAKDYDPVESLRREVRELRGLVDGLTERVARLEHNRERRYATLRGFRARAIRHLAAHVSYETLGQAFGVSRQRIEQIVQRGR